MPRVANGKRWVQRMPSWTAEELEKLADNLQFHLQKPANTDDPLWAQRGIESLRRAASRRERAALRRRIEREKRRIN